MTRITRRRVGLVASAVLLGAGLVYAARVASILVAYKAKMLCSEVFVAGRDPQMVQRELEVDDLAPLRYVSAAVDRPARRVTSSVVGIMRHDAVYRDGRGCVIRFGPDPAGGIAAHTSERRSAETPRAHARVVDSAAFRVVLDRAFAEPDPERPRRTRAVVIVRDGRIVAERYATGFTPETPLLGWSMTKTVMNALVGTLVREGRLALDRPVPVPEWQTGDDPRRAIRLDDLMRMSSGLRFNESPSNPLSDATISLLGSPETALYAVRKPLAATPGTRWQYSSGTTNIIARAVRAVINDDARYAEFPRRALFERLGMPNAVIETDASGTFVGSSFMYATAREWARLGTLYVQDGVWEGQRVLPEGWVAYTRTPAPADPEKRYGAHVWLQVAEEYRGDAVLPADAFHAIGHAGQFVTMIPSGGVVIVRLGLTRYPDAWDHTAFVREVLAAIESGVR